MTVERLGVVALTPEEGALDAALAKCNIDDDSRCEVAHRLVNLPHSLLDTMYHRRGLLADASKCFGTRLDNDTLAQMLSLNETPNQAPKAWANLTRAEQARAKRLGDYFVSCEDISAFPQGRPYAVDPAVVLYCAFILLEATGKSKFPVSRPKLDEKPGPRKPTGPMFRALMAALESHAAREHKLQTLLPIGREETPPPPDTETVAAILLFAKSKAFQEWAETFNLVLTADAVANQPAGFRHLVGLARKATRLA